MKLFKTIKRIFLNADVLLWGFPLLLLVPNIALDFTEQYTLWSKIANVLLPGGVYYLLVSLGRRTAKPVLWMTFFSIFAAFQIVLLSLYGESIIAVDMFVNVATTSVSEATELLGNLMLAIAVICLLYLPPIIMAICQLRSGSRATQPARNRARMAGVALVVLGIVAAVAARGYRPDRELFPANVISNLCSAVSRIVATQKYEDTSAGFSYHARATHPADSAEVYVLVIGETSRAENWQLMGYDRPTNPMLSKRHDVLAYPKALSESNTTHKSVPMLLSVLDATTFGDSIYTTRSVFDAFNEAGFSTAFISNQRRNHSFIDFFGEQADYIDFITDEYSAPQSDLMLVDRLDQYLSTHPSPKAMIVLHSYGSHFNYRERYPDDGAVFTPDDNAEASKYNRSQLINAYDNTIIYTDRMLDSVIGLLDARNIPAAMLYMSDHGEDIFDDSRERFLHASPTATYHQLHVPLLMWMSPEYSEAYPSKAAAAQANRNHDVSTSASAFHTIVDLAGIATPYYKPAFSLTDSAYTEPAHLFLNDYFEGVPLRNAGLREPDFKLLDAKGFTY